ncbi:hypothetical protein ACFPRL_25505 [Pseudoclavibacter helvolus]
MLTDNRKSALDIIRCGRESEELLERRCGARVVGGSRIHADVAVVPGFELETCDVRHAGGVSEHEAGLPCVLGEPLARRDL